MSDWGALARQIEGEVITDGFGRGRYATDASFYQIVPEAVVVPRRFDDVAATLAFAREAGVPLTARGGGTSQAGQTVNSGVVVDFSKHLNGIRSLDVAESRAIVEPGLVLDTLNRALKPHGLTFPVDVSTASRATIGGMAANNSCGGRSIRYGRMRENVEAIDALLADGTRGRFGPTEPAAKAANVGGPVEALVRDMLALGERDAEEVAARFRTSSGGSAATTSTRSPRTGRPTTSPTSSSARRARSPSPRRSSCGSPRCRGRRSSACATSQPFATRWRRRSTSSASGRRRSSWSMRR